MNQCAKMLINLTDVLTTEGRQKVVDADLEMRTFESRMGSYPLTEASPVHLVISNKSAGTAELHGTFCVTQSMSCDRCLKEVPVRLELSFERTVCSPEITDAGLLEEADEGVMEGYQLNVEALVYNELLMNQPEKVLCKPDCKGICKKCGKDLNEGECGCDTFVPDPRMAVLKDIFNANKEV